MHRAIATIGGWIETRSKNYVCVTPAHAIMDCYADPDLYPVYNQSGLTTPDGMSVVWILKLTGHSNVERVYGPDLLIEACRDGIDEGYRHFFYGGEDGVANTLSSRLQEDFPGIQIVGTYSPPFQQLSAAENTEIVSRINESNADILWVGLGSPRQEQWMADHIDKLNVPVLIGVGAAFDFLSGSKPQAPRWMQRSGLEWFYRFRSEPKRLWPRYRNYPKFIALVALQLLGLKQFAMHTEHTPP
jgi:N-acetylglucosaminyldiphosphoundecaprenol N-acetyl-beta-D-mannosaminyltransferase